MIFSKFKFHYSKWVLLVVILIFTTSCQPKTTEELVSELTDISKSPEERTDIAEQIAMSYDLNAVSIIENEQNDFTKSIFYTYNDIIKYYASHYDELNVTKQALSIKFINKMLGNGNKSNLGNYMTVRIFISGLENSKSINFNKKLNQIIIDFENRSSKKYVLDELFKNWKSNHTENTLNSILSFQHYASEYFISYTISDEKARDLMAHFGESVVDDLKIMMQNSSSETRYAAAEVLIKMIKLHPEAVKSLTNALKNQDLSIIASNYPFYIRLGAKGSEDLLLMTLRDNFNLTMGVDYLNCGNPYIEKGTIAIAKDYGYHVTSNVGINSGPIWGSANEDEELDQ